MLFPNASREKMIVTTFHGFLTQNETISQVVSLLSDIFVFSYPVFLVFLYLYSVVRKKKSDYRAVAIFTFFSTGIAVLLNISIQFFFDRQRPMYVLGLAIEETKTLLHSFLPTTSFPSDHAVVSFSFATALLVRGIKNKNNAIVRWSWLFYTFAWIMSIARIMTAVHWPTDILAGVLVGVSVPCILSQKKIYGGILRYIAKPVIFLQEKLFSLIKRR